MVLQPKDDDNMRPEAGPHVFVWESALQTKLAAAFAMQATEISARDGVNSRRYSGAQKLNASDLVVKFDMPRKAGAGTSGANLEYTGDSILTRELRQTGGVQAEKKRANLRVRPQRAWRVAERADSTLEYEHTDVSYRKGIAFGPIDYRSQFVQPSLRRQFIERHKLSATLSDRQSRPRRLALDSALEIGMTAVQAGGYGHSFSETLRESAAFGVAYFAIRGSNGCDHRAVRLLGVLKRIKPSETDTSSAQPNGRFSLSGSGDWVESDRAALEWSGAPRTTRRKRVGGLAHRTGYVGAALSGNAGPKYLQFDPSATRLPVREWPLKAGRNYRRRQFERDLSEVTCNTAHMSITYFWPKLARSR